MRGWRVLVGEPSLILFAVIPFILSVVVAGYSVSLIFQHLPTWVQSLTGTVIGQADSVLHYFYYPLLVASGLIVFIGGIFAAYFGLMVIAVPFYSLLADRTLSLFSVKPNEPFQLKVWLRNSFRMLRIALLKALIFFSIGFVLFWLSFVPVVNVFAVFASLLILSFDLMDYSFECLHYGFRRRLAFAFSHRYMWAGMAAGLALTLVVPGLTLVVAPGAVVGAALLIKESVHGS